LAAVEALVENKAVVDAIPDEVELSESNQQTENMAS
jgi:hypothetical protein